MGCPSCGGDDWSFASLVHQAGISHIESKARGAGVGVGSGGLGVGVGGSKQKGVQQTALSRAAAPPAHPSEFLSVLGGGLATVLAIPIIINLDALTFGGKLALFMGLIIGGAVAGWLYGLHRAKENNYAGRLAAWQRTKMCQRCGVFYID